MQRTLRVLSQSHQVSTLTLIAAGCVAFSVSCANAADADTGHNGVDLPAAGNTGAGSTGAANTAGNTGAGAAGGTNGQGQMPGGLIVGGDSGGSMPMPPPDPDACSPAITPEVVSQTVDVAIEVQREVKHDVVTELIPAVLLLVDKSASMNTNLSGSSTSRWDTMRNFLFEDMNNLLAPLQTRAFWGITHYSRAGATNPAFVSGECVGFSQAPNLITFQLNAFESMRAATNATTPSGGTPTGEAMARALPALMAHDAKGADKHLILVTDGAPDTCASGVDGAPAATQRVIDEATKAAAAGIRVHAIGISGSTELAHLTAVAKAGNGNAYQALDSASLRTALEDVFKNVKVETITETVTETKIEKQVVQQLSCELPIDFKAGSKEDFERRGGVVLAGQRLTLNDPNGWTINTAGRLELLGTACESYKRENIPLQIQTALACALVPVPVVR